MKTELLNGAVQSSIKYQYGDTGVLQERSVDGGTVLKTYTSQGEQSYTIINNLTSITNCYYSRDHLGSVREVVTSTGAVFVRYDYTPYGERSRVGGFASFEAEKGFTGHDYLVDSGLILTRFRAYDPRTARWLSRDPIGERGGMNLYGYVGGDPVNRWDPTGEFWIVPVVIVAGSIAIVWAAINMINGLSEHAIEVNRALKDRNDDYLDIMKGKSPCKNGDKKLKKALEGLQKESAEQAIGNLFPTPKARIKGPWGRVVDDVVGVARDKIDPISPPLVCPK
jgi:RHS repeat-associated protein